MNAILERVPASTTGKVNPLQTQRDGMAYAIALLARMQSRWGIGAPQKTQCDYAGWAVDKGIPGDPILSQDSVFRTGPQNSMLLQAFDDLNARATRDAILGFHVVWTEWVGSVIAGATPDADYYRSRATWEKLEEMPDYRKPNGEVR